MILLWVILGVMLAIAIARINKSNKLFWAAFTSFMVGIAAASVINSVNQEDEDDLTQVCPTQVVDGSSSMFAFLADVPPTTTSLVPNPAGQDTTPEPREVGRIQKSFKETLTDPPEPKPG